ncbi:MAG: Ltp family lipoprotein, partial [Terrisporobacter sp.]
KDVPVEKKVEDDVPTEYKSALKKAKIYSDTMSMSKAGLFEQLTSEYGEKFSKEAAQYALDNVEADWKQNALKKAKTYQDDMAMSPSAVYDQLVSEYGEQFTAEEAQYAVDNLE